MWYIWAMRKMPAPKISVPRKIRPVGGDEQDYPDAHQNCAENGQGGHHFAGAGLFPRLAHHPVARQDLFRLAWLDQTVPQPGFHFLFQPLREFNGVVSDHHLSLRMLLNLKVLVSLETHLSSNSFDFVPCRGQTPSGGSSHFQGLAVPGSFSTAVSQ
jgi:hypothetical protein